MKVNDIRVALLKGPYNGENEIRGKKEKRLKKTVKEDRLEIREGAA